MNFRYIFIGSSNDPRLPVINVNATEGENFLWGKTRNALVHIYKNYRKDYDWFLKGDTDAYFIISNLR